MLALQLQFMYFIMEQSCFLLQADISLRAEIHIIKILYMVVLQVRGHLSCATVSTVNVNKFT
jgi:hypothetical protein